MNLKTYQAKTMAEAMADVKRDLGRDAVILHTRSFRRGGLLGLGGRRMWEITAAPTLNVPARPVRGTYVSDAPAEPKADDSGSFDALESAPTMAATPRSAPEVNNRSFLSQQMADLRRMVESLVSRQGQAPAEELPLELAEFRDHLLAQDVSPELADSLIGQLRLSLTGQQLSDRAKIRAKLEELIVAQIPTADADLQPTSGKAKVIALIGPTGVGKTTTIAKLAADCKLRHGLRVGLITIDTYRIAAVDQLRTYAQIIDVPLKTVLTAGELQTTVRSMRDLDVVLIDTAGRSQNDRLRLSQLRAFLSASEADQVHLVISSTANRQCATNTLERFIPLGANRLIVTKLDEAATFGLILNISSAGKVPMGYVTWGQDVPEDFAAADARRMAGWVMNGAMEDSRYAV